MTATADKMVSWIESLLTAPPASVSGLKLQDYLAGIPRLESLADTVREVSAEIPSSIDWVLRIDGHTDKRPIHTDRFPSNWELSTARAVAIVKYLVVQGIPAHRLSANGFGQFQPIDPADTPDAYARNRRIELQLTNR